MVLISILISTYFIFFFFTLKKSNIINSVNIVVTKNTDLYWSMLVITFFIMVYIILFRVFKIFVTPNVFNLITLFNYAYFFNSSTLIALVSTLFIIFFFFKKVLIQNLKLNFLRLVYYFGFKSRLFFRIYIKITCWRKLFWFWILFSLFKLHKKKDNKFLLLYNKKILTSIKYFFKYSAILLLVFFFFFDIFFNNFYMVTFCNFLPYFGLYQSIYIIDTFMNNSLDPRYDACCVDCLYSPARYKIQPLDSNTVLEISRYLETICKF